MSVLGKILVKLGLDSSDFQQGTRDAERQTQDLTSKIGGAFKKLASGLAVGVAIKKAFDFGKEAYMAAAQMQGVERAFNNLNKPNLLSSLREATQGTVDDLELMQNAIQAKNFKIPLENLATYLKFAKQRADETGQSVDYLVQSIVLGVGRKSPLILDNLGISALETREEFAKTGDMAKAVANIIEREMGTANNTVATSKVLSEQASAAWKNTIGEIGKLSVIKEIGDWFNKASAATAKFISSLVNTTKEIGANEQAVRAEGIEVNSLIVQLTASNTKEEERETIRKRLNELSPKFITNLQNEKDATIQLTKAAKEYNDELYSRIALAAKEDQITAAGEAAEKAGASFKTLGYNISEYLGTLRVSLNDAKIEKGILNQAQGVTKWDNITDEDRKRLIANYDQIIASSDDFYTKLQKINGLLTKNPLSVENIRGIDTKPLRDIINQYSRGARELQSAEKQLADVKQETEDFKKYLIESGSSTTTTKPAEEIEEQVQQFSGLITKIQQSESEIKKLQAQAQKSGYTDKLTEDIKNANNELTPLLEQYKTLTGKEWGAKVEVKTNEDQLKTALKGSIAYLESEISKKEIAIKLTTSDEERANLTKELKQLQAVIKVKIKPDYQKGSEADLKNQLSEAQAEISKLDSSTESGAKRINELLTVTKNLNWQINNLPQNIKIDFDANFSNFSSELDDQIQATLDAYDKGVGAMLERQREFATQFSDILENGAKASIAGLGEAIGALASGNTDQIWQMLLNPIADMSIQLGQLAIATGLTLKGIKKGFESLNPFVAIAAGVALVALGTAVKGAIGSIGKGDSGSSSGYGNTFTGGYSNGGSYSNSGMSKANAYSTGQLQQVVVLETRVSGSDLILAQSREQNRRKR